jgi:hypothetical protein
MENPHAFTAHPVTRKSAPHWELVPSLRQDPDSFDKLVDRSNFMYLLAVREHCKLEHWKWGLGAEFLFSCLISALDLGDHKNRILNAARPKRGARPKTEIREYIRHLKRLGRNIRQIQTTLKEVHGVEMSRDAVRDNLKPPRKRSKQNQK